MIEAYTSLDNAIKFYKNSSMEGAQIPFNFELISHSNFDTKAPEYKTIIESWLNKVPLGCQANWVVS